MQARRQTPRRFGVFEDLTRFHPGVDWLPDLDIYVSPDAFVLRKAIRFELVDEMGRVLAIALKVSPAAAAASPIAIAQPQPAVASPAAKVLR